MVSVQSRPDDKTRRDETASEAHTVSPRRPFPAPHRAVPTLPCRGPCAVRYHFLGRRSAVRRAGRAATGEDRAWRRDGAAGGAPDSPACGSGFRGVGGALQQHRRNEWTERCRVPVCSAADFPFFHFHFPCSASACISLQLQMQCMIGHLVSLVC